MTASRDRPRFPSFFFSFFFFFFFLFLFLSFANLERALCMMQVTRRRQVKWPERVQLHSREA